MAFTIHKNLPLTHTNNKITSKKSVYFVGCLSDHFFVPLLLASSVSVRPCIPLIPSFYFLCLFVQSFMGVFEPFWQPAFFYPDILNGIYYFVKCIQYLSIHRMRRYFHTDRQNAPQNKTNKNQPTIDIHRWCFNSVNNYDDLHDMNFFCVIPKQPGNFGQIQCVFVVNLCLTHIYHCKELKYYM